jgi:TfoX/Sxy family transcriptional regulator of competence genes
MAYDNHLAERISNIFSSNKLVTEEKKMMGGLCYMLDDKMCCGIVKNELMARIGPDNYEEALKMPGCKKMNFTGRPMKGYVFVDPEAIDTEVQLEYWVNLCIDFNPLAKSSKKKK